MTASKLICVVSGTERNGEFFVHNPVFLNGYQAPTENIKVKAERSEPKVLIPQKDRLQLIQEINQRVREKRKRIELEKVKVVNPKDLTPAKYYYVGNILISKIEEYLIHD